MKMTVSLILTMLFQLNVSAQLYKISTDQTDPFSLALVKLMNCGINRFEDCKGDLIRRTHLMGDDYHLSFPFPGSTVAIVRYRDWDKNAYLEFRGFKNQRDVDSAMTLMINRIRKTLGSQLLENKTKDTVLRSSISIKDDNGYFSSSIEFLPGSSAAIPYLLGPEREPETGRKEFFFLIKVYGGIPAYQFYIKQGIISPDPATGDLLGKLIMQSRSDFDSLFRVQEKIKPRPRLIQMDGHEVGLNFRSSNRTATIRIPVGDNYDLQWTKVQNIIKAQLGNQYVYRTYEISGRNFVTYYSGVYDPVQPRITLDKSPEDNMILINVQSSTTHPVKRGLSKEDFE